MIAADADFRPKKAGSPPSRLARASARNLLPAKIETGCYRCGPQGRFSPEAASPRRSARPLLSR
ncbi:hypothetical protein HPP92_026827 [Vanilla planifolia]|uniref:Uncharacterized protein n=1 Tax=Vanilla planifolia TaxID=51239 RepID=A0A835PDS6_VANPL|nr:hypothetical protein HPP92_027015 [Vanilla planifolia]KAG0450301.1 hypothetical protein HPP92_026827 [Vanilla planifolia]